MNLNPFLQTSTLGKTTFWRVLAAIMLVIFIYLLFGTLMAFMPLILGLVDEVTLDLNPYTQTTAAAVSYAFNLLTFFFVALCLAFVMPVIHRRPFRTLITPLMRINWKVMAISALLWACLAALIDIVSALLIYPGDMVWTFDPQPFFIFALISLILIPIQSATEELFFRGYLMQTFSRGGRWPWLGFVINTVLFAALHGWNPEAEAYGLWIMLANMLVFGLLASAITLRMGGLEAAMGMHMANNLYAGIVSTFPSSALGTATLWTSKTFDPVVSLIGVSLSALVFWLLIPRLAKVKESAS